MGVQFKDGRLDANIHRMQKAINSSRSVTDTLHCMWLVCRLPDVEMLQLFYFPCEALVRTAHIHTPPRVHRV